MPQIDYLPPVKRAAVDAGISGLDDLFTGPTALAFVSGDPVEAAALGAVLPLTTLEGTEELRLEAGTQSGSVLRLPGGGGQVIGGLYDVVASKFGLVDDYFTRAENIGSWYQRYHGFQLNVSARPSSRQRSGDMAYALGKSASSTSMLRPPAMSNRSGRRTGSRSPGSV